MECISLSQVRILCAVRASSLAGALTSAVLSSQTPALIEAAAAALTCSRDTHPPTRLIHSILPTTSSTVQQASPIGSLTCLVSRPDYGFGLARVRHRAAVQVSAPPWTVTASLHKQLSRPLSIVCCLRHFIHRQPPRLPPDLFILPASGYVFYPHPVPAYGASVAPASWPRSAPYQGRHLCRHIAARSA